MRVADLTSLDEMKNLNMDLNNAMKDDWQEANGAQSYNFAAISGRCSEENDYTTEITNKPLQLQAAPYVDIGKFEGNLIKYQ